MIEYVFVIYSCKKNLKKANFLYSLIYNRLNNCKCYVSNSTFSGWATNLNTNPNKIIIVPKQWINVDYPYEIPFHFTESF